MLHLLYLMQGWLIIVQSKNSYYGAYAAVHERIRGHLRERPLRRHRVSSSSLGSAFSSSASSPSAFPPELAPRRNVACDQQKKSGTYLNNFDGLTLWRPLACAVATPPGFCLPPTSIALQPRLIASLEWNNARKNARKMTGET